MKGNKSVLKTLKYLIFYKNFGLVIWATIIVLTLIILYMFIIIKYLITAGVIVLASELAKSSDKLGALIVSLPLMTILTLIWLQVEWASTDKIANHAYYTFWYVLPTLPMFFVFPTLLQKYGFWWALWLSAVITFWCFILLAFILKRFGIALLP